MTLLHICMPVISPRRIQVLLKIRLQALPQVSWERIMPGLFSHHHLN